MYLCEILEIDALHRDALFLLGLHEWLQQKKKKKTHIISFTSCLLIRVQSLL